MSVAAALGQQCVTQRLSPLKHYLRSSKCLDSLSELQAIWQEIGEDKGKKLGELSSTVSNAVDEIYRKFLEEGRCQKRELEEKVSKAEFRLKELLGIGFFQVVAPRVLPLRTRLSINTSRLADLDHISIDGRRWTGLGFTMKIRQRILALREMLKLPPCNSVQLDEILASSIEDLLDRYPIKMARGTDGIYQSPSEFEHFPTLQRLFQLHQVLCAMERDLNMNVGKATESANSQSSAEFPVKQRLQDTGGGMRKRSFDAVSGGGDNIILDHHHHHLSPPSKICFSDSTPTAKRTAIASNCGSPPRGVKASCDIVAGDDNYMFLEQLSHKILQTMEALETQITKPPPVLKQIHPKEATNTTTATTTSVRNGGDSLLPPISSNISSSKASSTTFFKPFHLPSININPAIGPTSVSNDAHLGVTLLSTAREEEAAAAPRTETIVSPKVEMPDFVEQTSSIMSADIPPSSKKGSRQGNNDKVYNPELTNNSTRCGILSSGGGGAGRCPLLPITFNIPTSHPSASNVVHNNNVSGPSSSSLRGQPPPPPPPPPPSSLAVKGGGGGRGKLAAAAKLKRSATISRLYLGMKRRVEGAAATPSPAATASAADGNHVSLVRRTAAAAATNGSREGMAEALAEITRRSSYFRKIEDDVQKHAKSIMEVKRRLEEFTTHDMHELLDFHKSIESELEQLTDESQVLARFQGFPVRKLEIMRAAASLYSRLSNLAGQIKGWVVEFPNPEHFDKASAFFEKVKADVEALERTKDEDIQRFKNQKIYFSFEIINSIKEAIVGLSSRCLAAALKESERSKKSVAQPLQEMHEEEEDVTVEGCGGGGCGRDRRSFQVLYRAFHLAFRVHNFAGGHDDAAERLTTSVAREMDTYPSTFWSELRKFEK